VQVSLADEGQVSIKTCVSTALPFVGLRIAPLNTKVFF
jgi:hypothetical protein